MPMAKDVKEIVLNIRDWSFGKVSEELIICVKLLQHFQKVPSFFKSLNL